jgi:hypothetical protein
LRLNVSSQVESAPFAAASTATTPCVSVCMPLYNTERYVVEAIEGVLRQTHRNLELVICDNRSTDKSVEIVEGYARRDSRVRLVRNRRNLGYAGNLHKVLSLARGDYMIVHCADDFIAPDALEKMVAVAQTAADPARVLVISDYWVVDDQSRPMYVTAKAPASIDLLRVAPDVYSPSREVRKFKGAELLGEALRTLQIVGFQGASLYSRALFEEIEGLYSGLLYSPDAQLNYLLLDRNPEVLWLGEAVVSWRWTPGNQASQASRQAVPKHALDVYLITQFFSGARLAELGVDKTQMAARFVEVYCVQRAFSEIKNGSSVFALRHCWLALALYPTETLRSARWYAALLAGLLGPIGRAVARMAAKTAKPAVIHG